MIVIQLAGGMGNQMFQYACGRSLALKFNTDLLVDISNLEKGKDNVGSTSRKFELQNFSMKLQCAYAVHLKKTKPFFLRLINVISMKSGFGGIQTSKYFIENHYRYNRLIERVEDDCYLVGYWQSPKYFENIESTIREDFKFKPFSDSVNIDRSAIMKIENSVSLHIRRSDFIHNKYHDIHGTCSLDYYRSSVEYIATKISNPVFFVFSDDSKWTFEHLKLPYKLIFVSGNSGEKSYLDMHLMSLCKHNIIANSSFSWWGAWLNANPEKYVIAPKQWFKFEALNAQTTDLIPPAWIRL